jgi:thioredoxin 2
MMAPAFEQAATQLEANIRLAKVNTETEQTIGAQFGILSIPTLILFKNGQEAIRQPGAMSLQDIVSWTKTQLSDQA